MDSQTPATTLNPHVRDQCVLFDEQHHRYTINHPVWLQKKADGSGTISVTTLIHQLFPKFDEQAMATRIYSNIIKKMNAAMMGMDINPFDTGGPQYTATEVKYLGMSIQQIIDSWEANRIQASSLGTNFHKNVEDYLNTQGRQQPSTITTEFGYFLKFWHDLTTRYPDLSLYRTEWMVYDETIGLAGSMDCVLQDKQGNLMILDWKRSKEIKMSNQYHKGFSVFSKFEDCNWSHYQLQLNFYREILERHYNKRVVFMMNVVCHPDHPSYLCYPVQHIDVSKVWSYLPDLARQQQQREHDEHWGGKH